MLQNQCPDGTQCPNQRCCPRRRGGYGCCRWGRIANCCPDRITCCPRGWLCLVTERECVQQTYSSVLRVQAAVLVNSTGKRCRDGTAGMDLKSGRSIPSQQVETALKTSGFIGTSGDVSSPVEKYQCPDGTSTCELSSGIDGCCPIQNARWIKIVDTFPRPHSSEGMSSFWQESSCALVFGKLYFHYHSLNQLFSYLCFEKQPKYPN